MSTKAKLFAASVSAFAVSACATNPMVDQPGDSVYGEANRQTMMAQVINPDPIYVDPMTTSGEHAADAIERYRNNEVPDPAAESTTSGSSGGGGGGGD